MRVKHKFGTASMLFSLCLPAGISGADPSFAPKAASIDYRAEYEADVPKTIVELQQFRELKTIAVQDDRGLSGTASLIDLNPHMNAWFLLTLDWGVSKGRFSYHIENPFPDTQQVLLVSGTPRGLVVSTHGDSVLCDVWSGGVGSLERASRSSLPYAPICDGRLYLRNRVVGRRTELERVTDFLRDHVWGGEMIVGFVRKNLYRDAFRETAQPVNSPLKPAPFVESAGAPRPASLGESYGDPIAVPRDLGIDLTMPKSGQLRLGQWYPVQNVRGIYVSLMQPEAVTNEIITQSKGLLNRLDTMEASAVDYLVAFDLSQLDLGFALGTDHPRTNWSPRIPSNMRNDKLLGPDGIGTPTPLMTTGMVSPAIVDRVVATFTGGFKREHGAFKYGDLAGKNHGSHYGFIEQGVVFSKLQPGLATLYVLHDGAPKMKTWSDEDNRLLYDIKFARQNGVALVEQDMKGGGAVPGPLVTKWGPGNWSGSADEMLRTLRAGACLQTTADRQFLIYGYFSTATPSAMARVFQAYGCQYAMLLDMNALEHTYLALYSRREDKVEIQHLVSGMSEVDKSVDGQLVPRFLGYPDNRDFFYLVRKGSGS